jgi:hypothetical protein
MRYGRKAIGGSNPSLSAKQGRPMWAPLWFCGRIKGARKGRPYFFAAFTASLKMASVWSMSASLCS